MSTYHAKPSPFTFLSLICANGLKCVSSNVRPFSSQFVLAADSKDTRASVTSPAFAAVCSGVLQPALKPSVRHRLATRRVRSKSIETISLFRSERMMLVQRVSERNVYDAMLKTQRKKSQRSATKMDCQRGKWWT